MQTEYLDIVDQDDVVVRTAPREEIYAKAHPHRIVHVIVFNSKGEMALQLRSRTKSYCPSHWSTTIGGHVQAGETYEEAARRESLEEAGVDTNPVLAWKTFYLDPERKLPKYLAIFTATYDGPFRVGEDEVEEIGFYPLETIRAMRVQGAKFHPELAFILDTYYAV